MQKKPIAIFGVPYGGGARDPRCAEGPSSLLAAGLNEMLARSHRDHTYQSVPVALCLTRADPVGCIERELALGVDAAMACGQQFLVVGGDHSIAIGTWSGAAHALSRRGPLGLIWIDAHLDSHTPTTSPSGALHGMPLAVLLGFGDPLLSGVAGVGPKLLPGHVCLLGARSFEREEQALLARLGVRIFPMSEVLERGLATCFAEALALVRLRTAGFGVSVDLDALDPLDAPGVGSPVAGGIRGADLVAVLQGLAEIPGFCGLEVAELDPALDVKDATVRLVLDLVGAVWHAERGGPQ